MSKFNPDFWETTIAAGAWDRFAIEDGLWHGDPQAAPHRGRLSARAAALWPAVRAVMSEVLTDRQQEAVTLYFLGGLNQRQIAEALGISQQAVSEHLHGKMRNGRAVGGALRKLRKACAKRGIRWDREG